MWMTRRQTKTNQDDFFIPMLTLGFSETCHTVLWMTRQTKQNTENLQIHSLQMTNQTKTKKDNFSDLGPSVANSVDDEADKDKKGQFV
jgi:hypothetical protein